MTGLEASDAQKARDQYIRQQDRLHDPNATSDVNSHITRQLREQGPLEQPSDSILAQSRLQTEALQDVQRNALAVAEYDSIAADPVAVNVIELTYPFGSR